MEIEWFRSRREDTGELVDVPIPPQSRWYQESKQVQFLIRYFNHGSEETQMCFDALLGFQGKMNCPVDLHPDFFQSEEEWIAAFYGVSVSQLIDWMMWCEEDCQCRATTPKGKRCKNRNDIGLIIEPQMFDPEQTPFCAIHRPLGVHTPQQALKDALAKAKDQKPAIERQVVDGYVYLIEAKGASRFKIGFSKNPKKRLELLNQGHPAFPLEIVHYYFVDDVRSAEKRWHQAFSDLRRHGEWFELSEADVDRFTREEFK